MGREEGAFLDDISPTWLNSVWGHSRGRGRDGGNLRNREKDRGRNQFTLL